jgi:hypothetical protein
MQLVVVLWLIVILSVWSREPASALPVSGVWIADCPFIQGVKHGTHVLQLFVCDRVLRYTLRGTLLSVPCGLLRSNGPFATQRHKVNASGRDCPLTAAKPVHYPLCNSRAQRIINYFALPRLVLHKLRTVSL